MTDNDIDHLAKAMHNSMRDCPGIDFVMWNRLSKEGREHYRWAARQLLEHPPACLRRAIQNLTKKGAKAS